MLNGSNARKLLSRYLQNDAYDLTLDLRKSKGLWLYDSQHNRKILDLFGFFATSPLGMNHPKMFDKDFLDEMKFASLNKITNSDIWTVEMAGFVEQLSKIAPRYMTHFFFIEGGALAVENALKAAFDWKVRKNFAKGYKDEVGSKVIHLKEAFHGRSGYTLSLTNTSDPKKTEYYPKFDWPRVTNPKMKFPVTPENERETQELENKSIDEIDGAIKEYGNDIAAFIIEPIQAEGGDNHFRKQYLQEISRITRKNEIMFIVDEVQSGMGITGKWWAFEHFDIEPDVLAFGKKAQVCGIMVGPRIDEVKDNVFNVESRINSTWGGNIADMVRGKRYIEIMREDKLLDNAKRMGDYLLKRLNELNEAHPAFFSNPRGRGLMCAIDVKDSKARDEYAKKIFKNGAIILKCGEKGIRFRPPLIITTKEIDAGIGILEKSLASMR